MPIGSLSTTRSKSNVTAVFLLMTGGTINIVLLGCSATADIFIALQIYLSISYSTSGTVESLVEQQSLQKAQHMPQNVFSC